MKRIKIFQTSTGQYIGHLRFHENTTKAQIDVAVSKWSALYFFPISSNGSNDYFWEEA
jgi:hypothetical protein